jgi:hypothetical protein
MTTVNPFAFALLLLIDSIISLHDVLLAFTGNGLF